jgi:phage FluMu protein Com
MSEMNTEENQQYDLRDERCECGNLLCKISDETVEIKCRRCKRIHIIPIKKLVQE